MVDSVGTLDFKVTAKVVSEIYLTMDQKSLHVLLKAITILKTKGIAGIVDNNSI